MHNWVKIVFSRKNSSKQRNFRSAGCIKIWHQKLASVFSLGRKVMPSKISSISRKNSSISRKSRQFDKFVLHVRHFHVNFSYIFQRKDILCWFHEKNVQATDFGINIIKYFSLSIPYDNKKYFVKSTCCVLMYLNIFNIIIWYTLWKIFDNIDAKIGSLNIFFMKSTQNIFSLKHLRENDACSTNLSNWRVFREIDEFFREIH